MPGTGRTYSAHVFGGYSRQLNNYIQSTRGRHTITWEEYPSGELHRLIWTVVIRVDGYPYGSGADYRKNIARDQAAMIALMTLGVIPVQYPY
ncbi:hypothetical protein DL93DRAFT_2071929 [Clavulina sp. PMI_390]|nr:hypothetical protein DL93DRAFT_2071929 [Clavulina sp. PMI_390]